MGTGAKIEKLLTATEAAEILACSADHVVSLHRAGLLPAVPIAVTAPPAARPGRRMLRFRPADVRAYIDAHAVTMDPATTSAPTTARIVSTVGEDSLLWGRKGRKARG